MPALVYYPHLVSAVKVALSLQLDVQGHNKHRHSRDFKVFEKKFYTDLVLLKKKRKLLTKWGTPIHINTMGWILSCTIHKRSIGIHLKKCLPVLIKTLAYVLLGNCGRGQTYHSFEQDCFKESLVFIYLSLNSVVGFK